MKGLLNIVSLGGHCPVQAEGFVDGFPFYFRARGNHWSMTIANRVDFPQEDLYHGCPDAWYYEEKYGEGPFDAGWMELSEANRFIRKAVKLYRKPQNRKEV